jgi:predicted ATPase
MQYSFLRTLLAGLKTAGYVIVGAVLTSLISPEVREAITSIPWVGEVIFTALIGAVAAAKNWLSNRNK